MTQIHRLQKPEHTIDVGENLKIDITGASDHEVRTIKDGLQKDPSFWASVSAMLRQKPRLWRSREERNVLKELRVQAVKDGGRYLLKLIAVEGDGHIKRVATEMKLAEAHDAERLTLAISATFMQIYMAVNNVYRIVALMEIDSKCLFEEASPITRQMYEAFHKEFLLQYLSSTKEIMISLARIAGGQQTCQKRR